MAPRKNPSTAAELALVPLKKCFVNLPASLVNVLMNVDTPIQNVVVELAYRSPRPEGSGSVTRSVYVGWTGMPSRRKTAVPASASASTLARGSSETSLIEIDAAFAATLGLRDGQKVAASLHLDPPLAHTIHIEPLTPEDWEMVELHATFLELNLISQIRALPNPAASSAAAGELPHPLTLHLSPTSTANVRVQQLEPALPADVAFARVAPDAEVIVAPKTRPKTAAAAAAAKQAGAGSGRSVASTSRKSSGGALRSKARDEPRPALFLRGVDRAFCSEWFSGGGEETADAETGGRANTGDADSETGGRANTGDADADADAGLVVWADGDLLLLNTFRSVKYVTVTLLGPGRGAAASAGTDVEPATRVVAQLRPWDDPPNGQTAALSSLLCAGLGCTGLVGGVVKLEPAPAPLAPKLVAKVKLYPFAEAGAAGGTDQGSAAAAGPAALRLGGGNGTADSSHEREDAAQGIRALYGQGPLTDGLVLAPATDGGWPGGLLKLALSGAAGLPSSDDADRWMLGMGNVTLDVQPPIARPAAATATDSDWPGAPPALVGVDDVLAQLQTHLLHGSSVLLTGALGAGKTAVARRTAAALQQQALFHVVYVACRRLANEESRVAALKEALGRAFMGASWGARLGGRALVVLDDVDRLCPAETELVVQSEEGRSRQLSEGLCAVVRQYAGASSGPASVVVLATAQSKDGLHPVVVGGHVVRDMVDLKAPNKEARRQMLESLAREHAAVSGATGKRRERGVDSSPSGSRPTTADGLRSEDGWMGSAEADRRSDGEGASTGFVLEDGLDLLAVAGETDGFLPGDLQQLVARAQNEALVRSFREETALSARLGSGGLGLGPGDFARARRGFTPTALRNVALQQSATRFDSIGGLEETRRVLLETLAYPTKYAPIFAQCPLRLRSGLLLYGFPGCGKTLLASAVAGECGLHFISVKGPEILNKYIGASEKSVRDLFARAQAARPCVLFFDEFDAIAPKRGHDSTGVTDRVVNQLLTQMDGAEGLTGVYVLAATSRPDLIDPALLRPGRLDKSLLCGMPDAADRRDIVRAVLSAGGHKGGGRLLDSPDAAAQLATLAERTAGFSGADLQALVSNAQLQAIHDALREKEDGDGSGGHRKKAQGRPGSAPVPRVADMVAFRYGEGDAAAPSPAERMAMAAQLERQRLARRRERPGGGGGGGAHDAGSSAPPEVVLCWRHLHAALASTRPSISTAERQRLEHIYHEFVVGRSGDMPDGQASTQVGGRTSLM